MRLRDVAAGYGQIPGFQTWCWRSSWPCSVRNLCGIWWWAGRLYAIHASHVCIEASLWTIQIKVRHQCLPALTSQNIKTVQLSIEISIFFETFSFSLPSVEIITFSSLFYWNLYFLLVLFFWNLYLLITFRLKPLLLLKPLHPFHFPIEIVTFSSFSIEITTFYALSFSNIYPSLLFYWHLYFLITFLLEPLLAISTSLYLTYFLLKSLLSHHFSIRASSSLYFSIEISTFSALFFWNLYFPCTFLSVSRSTAAYTCFSYILTLGTQKFQRKAMPSISRSTAAYTGFPH